jgi:hypothetical protein
MTFREDNSSEFESRPLRRCALCRGLLRDQRERCPQCGCYIEVMRNERGLLESHASRFVHDAFAEGRAEQSIRQQLIEEGFSPELFEERLQWLAAQRRKSVRAWGIGQILIGLGMLVAGLFFTIGTYLIAAPGGKYIITTGLILFGAATLGRGLQAMFFRN